MSYERNDGFLDEGFRQCRDITRRYGTSFYFATRFFPREMREGIHAVYSFARIPDEIVDDPRITDRRLVHNELSRWHRDWRKSMNEGRSDDPVMNAIVWTFRRFNIPPDDGEAFLRSMYMDQEKTSYENYSELEDYMYGSAGVIGLMVSRIAGYRSDAALPYAIKLGYAFQLTNFLRDIREDYEDLGRVYMPADELASFGLTPNEISKQICDERFIEFMKFQIQRNRDIYREALPGIAMLSWRARLAIRVAYVLYKAILDEVERVHYNIYRGRVRTKLRQKLWLSAKAVVGVYE
jgi:15-cis-phytoene synthase